MKGVQQETSVRETRFIHYQRQVFSHYLISNPILCLDSKKDIHLIDN